MPPGSPASPTRRAHDHPLHRPAGVVFDMVVVYAVFAIRSMAWWRGPPAAGAGSGIPAWWWRWGSPADLVLFGPDAGDWAATTRALMEGGALDVHRLPLFCWLTSGMTLVFDDVVFAGHAVNHLVSAMVCVVVYVLGRTTSGRGPALGAALLVALSPALVQTQLLFGVDPTFQLTVVVLALCTWWAMRDGRAAVAAGFAAGLCASSHFLGLLFVVPAALLTSLAPASARRRALAPVVVLALASATWFLPGNPGPASTSTP